MPKFVDLLERVASSRSGRAATWFTAQLRVYCGEFASTRVHCSLMAGALALVISTTWTVQGLRLDDFWWNLAVGKQMTEMGHLLTSEPLVFAPLRHDAFLNAQWLCGLIYYAAYKSDGYVGILALHIAVVAVTFSVLAIACRQVAPGRLASGTAAAAFLAARPYLIPRPQTLCLPLFVIVCAWYWLIVLGPVDRRSQSVVQWLGIVKRRTLMLPFAMLLWVNLHGSYVLGLGLIGAGIVTLVARLKRSCDLSHYGQDAVLIFLVSLLAMSIWLINPYGPGALRYTWEQSHNSELVQYIAEWGSLSLRSSAGIAFAIMVGAIGLLFAFPASRPPRRTWGMIVAFTLLPFLGQRFVVWWPIALAPIVAHELSALLDSKFLESKYRASWDQGRAVLTSGSADRCRPGRGLECIAFTLLLIALPIGIRELGTAGAPPFSSQLPIGVATYLNAHASGGRVAAPLLWAAYLQWETPPTYRYLLDGRTYLLAPGVLADYFDVYSWLPNTDHLLLHYGVDTLIVRQSGISSARKALGPKWHESYHDYQGVVLVRCQGDHIDAAIGAVCQPEAASVRVNIQVQEQQK